MEYYTATPPAPSEIYEAIGDFLDGALDPLLQTDQGSLPIKFLYKYFGPGSVANELNKVITRQDGFFFLDGLKIIADSAPQAEIAAQLTLALRAAVLGLFGATGLRRRRLGAGLRLSSKRASIIATEAPRCAAACFSLLKRFEEVFILPSLSISLKAAVCASSCPALWCFCRRFLPGGRCAAFGSGERFRRPDPFLVQAR